MPAAGTSRNSASNSTRNNISASCSLSTSSRYYQRALKASDYETIRNTFNEFKPEDKTVLASGKVVEDVMLTVALKCKYEHPCQYAVLDLSDSIWNNAFTEEEKNEIKRTRKAKLSDPLPPAAKAFTDKLLSKRRYIDVVDVVRAFEEDQLSSLYFFKTACLKAASLFARSNTLTFPVLANERYLIRQVWGLLSHAFDCSDIDAIDEKESMASCCMKNVERALASEDSMSRLVSGVIPDLLYVFNTYELGGMEAGIQAKAGISTKTINEKMMKLPMMLAHQLLYLKNQTGLNDLSTHGFLVDNLSLTAICCEQPKNGFLLVTKIKPLAFPKEVENLTRQLVPILQVVYNVKKGMLEIVSKIKSNNTNIELELE
ncbi:hypothetical protein EDC96DRAFT_518805 [Choanephora cucurbitarum]|nr:hypothetical protein EDC96DRAFT_518805 [Choanephora cucurbitarum]